MRAAVVLLCLTLHLHHTFVPMPSPAIFGLRERQREHRRGLACHYAHGAAGVKGKDVDLEELAMEKEREAAAAGLTLDKRLAKLRKAEDFIRYAKSHGASVASTKSRRMRISKDGVWHDVAGQGSGKELMKSERTKMLTSFKAMGIAFKSKA